MNVDNSRILELIDRARGGDRHALGDLLDTHRPYLKFLALRQLGSNLGHRIDASDIVQQTCILVMDAIGQFKGTNEQEFIAWLRAVHEHNAQNVIREHVKTKKRSVDREDPYGYEKLDGQADDEVSPSRRLMVSEDAVRLARAIDALPGDQGEAVRLRYLEGWSLAKIAEKLDRSLDGAAGLVRRGLINLRKELRESP